jgi:hypothetical protein
VVGKLRTRLAGPGGELPVQLARSGDFSKWKSTSFRDTASQCRRGVREQWADRGSWCIRVTSPSSWTLISWSVHGSRRGCAG